MEFFKKLWQSYWDSMERDANRRRVFEGGGLQIEGDWVSREIHLNGQKLELEILSKNKVRHNLDRFCWGEDSPESCTTALAILLWFQTREEAFSLRQAFLRDYISKCQKDFRFWFPFERWRNTHPEIFRKLKKKPVDTESLDPEDDD